MLSDDASLVGIVCCAAILLGRFCSKTDIVLGSIRLRSKIRALLRIFQFFLWLWMKCEPLVFLDSDELEIVGVVSETAYVTLSIGVLVG